MTVHHTQLRGEDYAEQEFVSGASAFDFMARAITSTSKPETDEARAVKKSTRASNAAGVSMSWHDPEVLSSRLTRNGVSVSVEDERFEFRSTRAAFKHFRLPDSKHIRFRIALKASTKEKFEYCGKTYLFTLLE